MPQNEKHIPVPLLAEALWHRSDMTSLEHCRLMEIEEFHAFQGVVLAVMDAQPCQIQYAITCYPDWSTRAVHIAMVSGEATSSLRLHRSEAGEWSGNDERLPEFDGISDIDLSISPATNTLPIRRLNLSDGASGSTDALWVRFPRLTLERLPQTYTRVDERRYLYESASFRADLEVDHQGLVVRYGDIWERVST